MQVGQMLIDYIMDRDNKPMVAFIIKEKKSNIDKINRNPTIQRCFKLIEIENVLLGIVLLRFNNNPGLIYQAYYNYYSDLHRNRINVWFNCLYFSILMLDETNQCIRHIQIPNTSHLKFIQMKRWLQIYKPWTEEEFEKAKGTITQIYPDVKDLWEAIFNEKENL